MRIPQLSSRRNPPETLSDCDRSLIVLIPNMIASPWQKRKVTLVFQRSGKFDQLIPRDDRI
jgi:hypothetical protein